MLDGKKALALSMQYTEDSLEGVGAIAGKPCQIQSVTNITGGHRVTFLWVDNSDVEHTTTLDVMDGKDGQDGATGNGIASIEKTGTQGLVDTYTITYTDGDTFEFEVTNGSSGGGGAVDSVNGKTGVVVLTASDVGAVAQEQGKGLSSNDYTDTDKAIVDGVTSALADKVDKVSGKGLSENDYTDADKTIVDGVTSALGNKADATDVIDGASYDSTNHLIQFKNGSTVLFTLDATAFVKDGMVDTVTISGGNLVITFNTDAGKQDISIPLSDIFDPNNYYNKTATDNLLNAKADKVASATNGDFAGLDSNGNLTDSGKKASDFSTPSDIQDVYEVMGKQGAKNLLAYPYANTTKTPYNVTFTDNGDGTITADGTATDNAIFYIHTRFEGEANDFVIPNGTYILNGCPANGSTSTYYMNVSITKNGEYVNLGNDIGEGCTFTVNGDDYGDDEVNLQVTITVINGATVSDLVFKPMIRLASDTDTTYQPYAKTNQELTKNVDSHFIGTTAQWNALSLDRKKTYTTVDLTDDGETGDVVDVVADGNMNPVTSNAVYDAMSQKFLYKRLQGTTDNFGLLSTGLLATDYYVLGADSQDVSINSFRSSNGYWYMHVFDATGETKKQTNIDTTIIYTPNDNLVSDGS